MSLKNTEIEDNPYTPYPSFFKKYGSPEQLEKWPHGEYLRKSIVDTIRTHKEHELFFVKYRCMNCGFIYFRTRRDTKPCPFCRAPYKYDIEKMKGWVEK